MNIAKTRRIIFSITVGLGLAVSGFAQSFLTNGLVAYYPFNGTANDASGNGLNGTNHGAVLTADRFGFPNKAYLFDGSSAYITAPLTSAVFSGDFTASVWLNVASIANGWPNMLDEENEGFRLSIAGDDCGCSGPGRFVSYASIAPGPGTQNWLLNPPQRVPVSTFQQLVVTKEGLSVKMYVNGQIADTNEAQMLTVPLGQYLNIGRAYTMASGEAFHGVLDDIRMYSRALSSQEVAQLYAIEATPPPGFETNGLVAYYPFNGNANDTSANGNNGTVHGATLTTDRFGTQEKAMAFNGIDQYVEAPHQPYLNFPAGDFTVTCWTALNDLSRLQYLVGKDMGQGIANKWITAYSPNPTFSGFGFLIDSGAYAFGDVKPQLGTWHQVVYRKAASRYSVHLDGAQVSTGEGPVSLRGDNTAALRIGQCEEGGYVNGKMDDIRIYNRSLTAEEVTQLYGMESGPQVDLVKAVKPRFSYLWVGTNYQLQVSADMSTWTNYGSPFTATNSSLVYPQYFDVENWGGLYFRLH